MAGAEAQATLRVGLEGDAEVVRGGQRIEDSWTRTGDRLRSSVGGAVREVGRGMAGLAQDALRVATAMHSISLASLVEESKRLDSGFTRFSIGARTNLQQLKQDFRGASLRTLVDEDELRKASAGYGRLTYNLKGALKDVEALNKEATASGRSLGEEMDLGATMRNSLRATGDMETALGKVRAQAEAIGTTGGPEAFEDLLVRLSSQMGRFGVDTDASRNKLTGFLAELTKGYSPESAQRIGGTALGAVQGNVGAIERTLGRRIRNAKGQVEDPGEVLLQLRDRVKRNYGQERGEKALANLFGGDYEAAAALMGASRDNVRTLMGVEPSKRAGEAQEQLQGSKAGIEELQALKKRQGLQDAAGPVRDLQGGWNSLFEDHPVASTIASFFLGGAANAGLKHVAGRVLSGGAGAAAAETAGAGAAAATGAGAAATTGAGTAASALGRMGELATGQGAKAAAQRAAAAEAELAGLQLAGKTAVSHGAKSLLGKALSFAGPLGLVYEGLSFQKNAFGALDKDGDFAKGVRSRQAHTLGQELAGQALRAGAVTPEIYAKAGGNKEAIDAMIQILAEQRDRLPPDLAAQIGAAVAEALRKQPPQLVMPSENSPAQRTQAAKADDEGRT